MVIIIPKGNARGSQKRDVDVLNTKSTFLFTARRQKEKTKIPESNKITAA